MIVYPFCLAVSFGNIPIFEYFSLFLIFLNSITPPPPAFVPVVEKLVQTCHLSEMISSSIARLHPVASWDNMASLKVWGSPHTAL